MNQSKQVWSLTSILITNLPAYLSSKCDPKVNRKGTDYVCLSNFPEEFKSLKLRLQPNNLQQVQQLQSSATFGLGCQMTAR